MAVKTGTKATTKAHTKVSEGKDLEKLMIGCLDVIAEGWYDFAVYAKEFHAEDFHLKKGYEDLNSYTTEKFKMSDRTFQSYVSMGIAIEKYGVTKEQVKHLKFSVFKEISTLVDEDTSKSQFESYVNKIQGMKFEEVKDYVKEIKTVSDPSIRKVEVYKIIHTLIKEQKKVYDEAMAIAKELSESENENVWLEYALTDFVFNHKPSKAKEIRDMLHEPKAEPEKKAKHKPHINKGKKKATAEATKDADTKKKKSAKKKVAKGKK